MADNVSFSEDISALWGAPHESALKPPGPNGTVANGWDPKPAPTNGRPADASADEPRHNVARLADALAGHQLDIVRHSELDAMRADMEDAFTQKLAVALYEVLSASNERFSSVEDHMVRRLQDVAAEVSRVGELVASPNADGVRQSQDAAALIERLESGDMWDAAVADSLDEMTQAMASVQGDLTEMQEAMKALREEVSNLRRQPGARRRWGRSG